MRVLPIINRFNFGEVSPLICARGDLVKYQAGCKTLVNFIPLLQGPVRRRGGTRFIAKAANGSSPVALLNFAFSETTTYILEAGNHYLRFYCQGRQILKDGQPYQIETPWKQEDLFYPSGICALKYVQSGDIIYIVSPGTPPQKLSRHGHDDWRLEELPGWNTAEQKRPNAVAIALWRERLCLAAGQTIYLSQSGAFENFEITDPGEEAKDETPPIAADDPIEVHTYSEQMDKIEWLCPSGGLLVGTSGGEFIVGETTSVDPLGPENIKVIPETAFGSTSIQALRVGAVVLFVQRAGRKVREFVYDYSGDSYAAMDVTVAAEHITKGGLTSIVWQSEPIETLWAARPDGQLIGFTYCREQDMTAWHRHTLGGGGRVSHLAVIPATHGGHDELWLSVAREVEGETVYYLETMDPGYDEEAGLEKAFFVDSGVTVTGQNLNTVEGLEHLEGLEISLLADGGVQPRQIVQNGMVKLQYPAGIIQVGLPYDSILSTVNLEAQLADGSVQSRLKRFTKVSLRLVDSAGGAAGPNLEELEELEYRSGGNQTDEAPPLFSGDKVINWPEGYETEGTLTVVQRYPLPFTLAAIIPEVSVGGTQ